jgi:uncharacterized protein YcfL
MKYRCLVLLSPLIFLAGCRRIPSKKVCNNRTIICKKPSLTELISYPSPSTIEHEPHTITIWIHGTRAFFANFIYKDFFYTRRGLHCATEFEPRYHLREIAELLHNYNPERFSINDFCFFGWSGKLSFKARHKAAQKLHKSIVALLEDYEKKYGYKPKLRIITHSHGGNVALNLARFNEDLTFQIDELILLACPVQKRTAHLSQHETFKRVYSLYSRFDSFQILDPQRIYYWFKKDLAETPIKPDTFFSQRCFEHHEKILQVQLKLNNRGVMHIEFLTNKFIGVLPSIMNEIQNWNNNENYESNVLSIKFT